MILRDQCINVILWFNCIAERTFWRLVLYFLKLRSSLEKMSARINILKDRMKYLLLHYKKRVWLFWSLFYIVTSFYILSILLFTQAIFFCATRNNIYDDISGICRDDKQRFPMQCRSYLVFTIRRISHELTS